MITVTKIIYKIKKKENEMKFTLFLIFINIILISYLNKLNFSIIEILNLTLFSIGISFILYYAIKLIKEIFIKKSPKTPTF